MVVDDKLHREGVKTKSKDWLLIQKQKLADKMMFQCNKKKQIPRDTLMAASESPVKRSSYLLEHGKTPNTNNTNAKFKKKTLRLDETCYTSVMPPIGILSQKTQLDKIGITSGIERSYTDGYFLKKHNTYNNLALVDNSNVSNNIKKIVIFF